MHHFPDLSKEPRWVHQRAVLNECSILNLLAVLAVVPELERLATLVAVKRPAIYFGNR
jgi:hypothetical protein